MTIGGKDAPVIYSAYPNEKVTLSAGRKLVCKWVPYKDGIMMTLVASAQNDDTALRRDVQQDVWAMQRSCVASDYLF